MVPDVPMHVVQRGNNRAPVFMDDADRTHYHRLLAEGCARLRCAVHAYAFMTNHVHLLITPGDADTVSRLMQWLGRNYVQRFNRRHGRTGTLWEGRFHANLIDSARYFLGCSRYIDQNPVRAGIVRSAASYRWSSHARLACGTADELVTEHAEYVALGATPLTRQAAYRDLCVPAVDSRLARRIRRAAKRGDALGSRGFVVELQQRLRRPVHRLGHGGDRRSAHFHTTPRDLATREQE